MRWTLWNRIMRKRMLLETIWILVSEIVDVSCSLRISSEQPCLHLIISTVGYSPWIHVAFYTPAFKSLQRLVLWCATSRSLTVEIWRVKRSIIGTTGT